MLAPAREGIRANTLAVLMNRVKIFLTGAEGIGWALDTEYVLARRSLSTFADVVGTESAADVIHTVWPESTYTTRSLESGFGGVPVVAALNNDPFAVARLPGFIDFSRRHYSLVAQSSLARKRLGTLGFTDVPLVPIIADLDSYSSIPRDSPDLARFAELHDIPRDRYLIGLLQRDSLGSDLNRIKVQKGPDVFLAILSEVVGRIGTDRIHVIIAGPRRHWLRAQLSLRQIPFTFVGNVLPGDDHPGNILDKKTMNLLYNLLDLYLIPTRWEGAPRQVFDVGACQRKILSSRVGAAVDVLDPYCIFRDILQAAERIVDDVRNNTLEQFIPLHHARIMGNHTPEAVAQRWRELYVTVGATPVKRRSSPLSVHLARGWETAVRTGTAVSRIVRRGRRRRVDGLRIWQDEVADSAAVFRIGSALRHALAAPGIQVVPREQTEVPYHIVDVGQGQKECLQQVLELPSLRSVLVIIPSNREKWPELVSMIARDPRCIAVCASATQLGALAKSSGSGMRSIVIPPFFEVHVEQAVIEARVGFLVVPNEAIHEVLRRRKGEHPPIIEGWVACAPTASGVIEFAARLRRAQVLVADRDTPYEVMRLAQFFGVPVVCDKENPGDEFGIGACLEYEAIEEIPRLVQALAHRREEFLKIGALPTATETARSMLAALGVSVGTA